MEEEKLKELEDLVDDALSKETEESLNEWMYQKQELETYRAFIDEKPILPEHSDEYILQKYASMVGKDFYLNQIDIRKDIIKQQKSYWDVTITYELDVPAFNHTRNVSVFNHISRREWTFTSNDTGASILSVLDMALSEFDVLRYDFLRAGFELHFIDLNIKLIEK